MGFLLITESMSFIPSNYGIDNKTAVTAILVGSGAGGSSAKSSNGTVYSAGGMSGCGGVGWANSSFSSCYGGGGGGGGFGAGGGGGAYGDSYLAGNGGGAGEIVTKNIIFSDPSKAVAITIGQRVSADTPGESTSIGSFATASGGKVNAGGKGRNQTEYGGGGGGGAGGFQLGMWFIESTAGSGGERGRYYDSPYATAESGTGAGGGGGGTSSTGDNSSGGRYGGGAGGYSASNPNGDNGWCIMGKAGNGVVLLIW